MFFVVISSMGAEQSGSFRIAFAMEKEERKLALKMGKTASFYRIIAAFVIM
jgi:hypothetical protein